MLSNAFAEEPGDFVVTGGPMVVPIVGGELTTSNDSVDYSDMFKMGWGFGLDGMFVVTQWLRAGMGIYPMIFPGDDIGGAKLNKWWVVPVMIGAKVLPFKQKDGWPRPYLRLDLGVTFYAGTRINNPDGSGRVAFFTTSTAFSGDVGGGLEYKFTENWGIFGEACYLFANNPIGAGKVEIHDPKPAMFVPVRFGVLYAY